MAMTQNEMMKEIVFASEGDKIKLRNGEIVEFVKLNRTKFVFKREDGMYNININAFVEIVEKAPPKKINQSYKKLKEGELFFINYKEAQSIYAFIEIKNGKIKARNLNGGKITIDIPFYGGKLSELKKMFASE